MINVCIRIRPLIFYVNICCFVVEHYSKKLKSFSLTDIPKDAESIIWDKLLQRAVCIILEISNTFNFLIKDPYKNMFVDVIFTS